MNTLCMKLERNTRRFGLESPHTTLCPQHLKSRANFRRCLCRQLWFAFSESPPYSGRTCVTSKRVRCVGLRIREASLGEDVADTCSTVANMLPKTSPARWWRFYRGLGALLKRKAVTGVTVQKKILGVCTVVRSSYRNPTPFWNSVRFELSLFRELMVYLVSRWRSIWNSVVMCSDASMTGWGLTGAERQRMATCDSREKAQTTLLMTS